jgi:hypothetical protein
MTKPTHERQTAALEKLTVRQLQVRHKKLTGKATRSKNRATLIKRCTAALTKPPVEKAPKVRADKRRRQLDVGSVLTRTHKGQEIIVNVTPDGFDWNGTTYTSLSTLAKAIVGYHTSGPAFFRLGRE